MLRLVGNGDQKKFTKNPRHFSMQNSQANTKKIFTKCFWRGGKVNFWLSCSYILDRPCASQEGASMLLRREGGFLRRDGGFLRRGGGFLRSFA